VLTCTWAPTGFAAPRITSGDPAAAVEVPAGAELDQRVDGYVRRLEEAAISHLLVAQRWWGSGEEIEGSTLDCLAMTAWFAARTERIHLVTAVHPGFFLPAPVAKWGATLDRLTGGRWSINVTSGWHLAEFGMYGVDQPGHDERYQRSAEFIQVLRGAWEQDEFSFAGDWYRVEGLRLEPRPTGPLTVFQGGQSAAAVDMAAQHSDWMFLNGGPPEKVAAIIERVQSACVARGRTVRFALYARPLCRPTDAEAWDDIRRQVSSIDPHLAARRAASTGGAEGMWAPGDDDLALLDTNEGYASRLIGSPDTVRRRVDEFRAMGVEMLHLHLGDRLFREVVLPDVVNA
jgi:FMNH2-dependent dimethyl sulfone monooxygenase